MSERPNPRKNADDAYAAFMGMPDSEWLGLLRSLMGSDGVPGGCLEIEEQKGFDRALLDRAIAARQCPATQGLGHCCYPAGHDLTVFPHRFVMEDNDARP